MFQRIQRTAIPALVLAVLLLSAESSYAQWSSFPGDWPQPGRGPGYGRSGFARPVRALPFPYNGVDGYYTAPLYVGPAYAEGTYQALYPTADGSRAYIRVRVAAGARVFFDDSPTTQTGADRLFVSPPLEAGHNYHYQLSARWTQDGHERTATRTVHVVPGQTVDVDIAAP